MLKISLAAAVSGQLHSRGLRHFLRFLLQERRNVRFVLLWIFNAKYLVYAGPVKGLQHGQQFD